MFLYIDIDKCRGCRSCELACSFKYDKKFNPSISAISVIKHDEKGINLPIVCRNCEKPICVEVCTSGALTKSHKTNNIQSKDSGIKFNEYRCVGCKTCITSCPFGGVVYIVSKGIVRRCDFCGGEPECEKVCPYEAIKLIKDEKLADLLRRKFTDKILRL